MQRSVKLYTKVVLVLCAVFVAYGLIDYTIQKRVILPSFESLEADSARTDMERATRALDRELTQLMTCSADWGNWIDTYAYVIRRNEDFIAVNMNPSFLNSSGIELVAFLDREGRYIWRQVTTPTHAPLHYSLLDPAGLEAGHPFLAAIAVGQRNQGIVPPSTGPCCSRSHRSSTAMARDRIAARC
jgi:sensor domain CHASE-containing protein